MIQDRPVPGVRVWRIGEAMKVEVVSKKLRQAVEPFVVAVDPEIPDETVLVTIYSPYVMYRPRRRRAGEFVTSVPRQITAGQFRALAAAMKVGGSVKP